MAASNLTEATTGMVAMLRAYRLRPRRDKVVSSWPTRCCGSSAWRG